MLCRMKLMVTQHLRFHSSIAPETGQNNFAKGKLLKIYVPDKLWDIFV